MKKLLGKLAVSLGFVMAGTGVAKAAGCAVCTVAVGAALEGARRFGLEDVVSGVWAGGLIYSLMTWTAVYMHKKGVQNKLWYALNFIMYYGLLAMVYVIPVGKPYVVYNESCMWGVDQFLLGTVVGSLVFWGMDKWYERIKRNNGGHAYFPFQKVVMPFTGLLITTLIFWAILRWLPQVGIVLC